MRILVENPSKGSNCVLSSLWLQDLTENMALKGRNGWMLVVHLQLNSGLLNPELPEASPEASHFLLGDGGTIGR